MVELQAGDLEHPFDADGFAQPVGLRFGARVVPDDRRRQRPPGLVDENAALADAGNRDSRDRPAGKCAGHLAEAFDDGGEHGIRIVFDTIRSDPRFRRRPARLGDLIAERIECQRAHRLRADVDADQEGRFETFGHARRLRASGRAGCRQPFSTGSVITMSSASGRSGASFFFARPS